jgi:hypothetical protein
MSKVVRLPRSRRRNGSGNGSGERRLTRLMRLTRRHRREEPGQRRPLLLNQLRLKQSGLPERRLLKKSRRKSGSGSGGAVPRLRAPRNMQARSSAELSRLWQRRPKHQRNLQRLPDRRMPNESPGLPVRRRLPRQPNRLLLRFRRLLPERKAAARR